MFRPRRPQKCRHVDCLFCSLRGRALPDEQQRYCVAPIIDDSKPEKIQFWAAGQAAVIWVYASDESTREA